MVKQNNLGYISLREKLYDLASWSRHSEFLLGIEHIGMLLAAGKLPAVKLDAQLDRSDL